MNSMQNIDKLLTFDLKGKFAHFKKYYTNVSSLTYEVPPRTVVIGMIASILGNYPRDSYYQLLSPQNSKVSVKLMSRVRKHLECLNYRKKNGGHTQVRLQLLLPVDENIVYRVYFWHKDPEIMSKLKESLEKSHLGYGLYFGQRQFRASAQFVREYESDEIKPIETDDVLPLSTLTFKENNIELGTEQDMEFVEISMPCHMKKVEKGREQQRMVNVCYERNGNPIFGRFKKLLKVKDDYIAFFTSMEKKE